MADTANPAPPSHPGCLLQGSKAYGRGGCFSGTGHVETTWGACMGNMLLAGCPAIHLICAAIEGCSRIKDQPVHHILWRTAKHKIVLQLPFIHQLLQQGIRIPNPDMTTCRNPGTVVLSLSRAMPSGAVLRSGRQGNRHPFYYVS